MQALRDELEHLLSLLFALAIVPDDAWIKVMLGEWRWSSGIRKDPVVSTEVISPIWLHPRECEKCMHRFISFLNNWQRLKEPKNRYFLHSKANLGNLSWVVRQGHTMFHPDWSDSNSYHWALKRASSELWQMLWLFQIQN